MADGAIVVADVKHSSVMVSLDHASGAVRWRLGTARLSNPEAIDPRYVSVMVAARDYAHAFVRVADGQTLVILKKNAVQSVDPANHTYMAMDDTAGKFLFTRLDLGKETATDLGGARTSPRHP